MRDAAGKASTQGDTDCWYAVGLSCNWFTREFPAKRLYRPDDLSQTLHKSPTFRFAGKRKPYIHLFNKMPRRGLELQATCVPCVWLQEFPRAITGSSPIGRD